MNDRTITIVGGVVCVGIIALIIVVAVLKKQEKYISPEPTYPLPPGNYQDTCTGAKMIGTTLVANCLVTGEDFPLHATLRNANKCSYVTNNSYQTSMNGTMNETNYTGILECAPYLKHFPMGL